MAIADVISRARGRAGHWRVSRESRHDAEVATLYHYGTAMLSWNVAEPTDPRWLDYSTGWGSVSDQAGMNQAFRLLGLPLYYSRKGGADILERSDPEQARRMPRYLWSRGQRREVRYEADSEALEREAERLGRQAGEAAGSWVFDGRSSAEDARRVLDGYDDGDPVVMDLQPTPLSGEWSCDVRPADILASVGPGLDDDDPRAEEIVTAYEQGYSDGFWSEVLESARYLAQPVP